MKPIQQTLKDLDLNMETLQGRYRFALLVLESQTQRRAHPIQPESLAGVQPSDIRAIRQKKNVVGEDRRIINVYSSWFADVLKIEGINEINLRSALRSVSIFEEATEDALAAEKEEIQLKREHLVYYIKQEFAVDSAELEQAIADPFGFARKKCMDLAAFPRAWRNIGN